MSDPSDATRNHDPAEPWRSLVVRLCHAFDMRPTLPEIRVSRVSPLMRDAFEARDGASPRSPSATPPDIVERLVHLVDLYCGPSGQDLGALRVEFEAVLSVRATPDRAEVERAVLDYGHECARHAAGFTSQLAVDAARAALLSLIFPETKP